MYAVAVLWVIKCFAEHMSSNRKKSNAAGSPLAGGKKKRKAIDDEALIKSVELVKICFSSCTSRESFTLYGLILVLLCRTLLSIVVADVDGQIVKTLINKDRRQVVLGALMWLSVAVPSSFINSLIKYLTSRLSLGLRAKLVAYTREKFFENESYYRVSQVAGGRGEGDALTADSDISRALQHPESVLTEDIANWADRFAELMSSIGKPVVDLAFFSALLYKRLGFINQFTASVLVWESGLLLKRFRPDFGSIVQERGSLEADLRSKHTKIIDASEEIAFCRGEQREKDRLSSLFSRIDRFQQDVLGRQIFYHTIEDFVTKYVWSAIGMVQVAVPLLKTGTNAGDNAKYFITVRRIMIRNGDAVERCLAGIKDAVEFNGYTMKIVNLLKGFEQLAESATQRRSALAEKPLVHEGEEGADGGEAVAVDDTYDIVMRDVPIRTPTGETLLQTLNLALRKGDRLLVLGPNGCGKSSLFRVLCGLWPYEEGTIKKPEKKTDLFFVPQKPYLVAGTFRDQVIYPDTADMMSERGVTDTDVLEILSWVLMTGPLEAHGGLDAVKEWSEVLSGGEKQRLGLARVFYHRPKFAILDECSSAINVEAESVIFRRLIDEGMGLITISHRQTLFPFHNKLLTFDGEGHSSFDDSFQVDDLSKANEKKQALMHRLQKVLQELGENWPSSVQDSLRQSSEGTLTA